MSLKRQYGYVFLQDKIVELFGCMHQTQRTDGELGSVSFDTSGRELYVFVVHRILYIQRSDSIAGHLDGSSQSRME